MRGRLWTGPDGSELQPKLRPSGSGNDHLREQQVDS
jgi:hypothetical protein